MLTFSGRSFLRLLDLTTEEIEYLLKLSKNFKGHEARWRSAPLSRGQRTSFCFSRRPPLVPVAPSRSAVWIWAWASPYLIRSSSQMGKKESIEDTARVLGRMYDGIEFRGFAQD